MTQVWFCSDLHFGHKNIQKFRHHIVDEEDNTKSIKADWKDVVGKRDHVYVLGDACFTMERLKDLKELPGEKKFLIRGNHDMLDTSAYLKVFDQVYGLFKYREFWLSHAPIHPNELIGRVNLHGHVHYQSVDDKRYFNCCVENIWRLKQRSLISLDELRKELM